ncbi:hypothetical protein KCU95_g14888, partial [Aureobasidium melanogenum]
MSGKEAAEVEALHQMRTADPAGYQALMQKFKQEPASPAGPPKTPGPGPTPTTGWQSALQSLETKNVKFETLLGKLLIANDQAQGHLHHAFTRQQQMGEAILGLNRSPAPALRPPTPSSLACAVSRAASFVVKTPSRIPPAPSSKRRKTAAGLELGDDDLDDDDLLLLTENELDGDGNDKEETEKDKAVKPVDAPAQKERGKNKCLLEKTKVFSIVPSGLKSD